MLPHTNNLSPATGFLPKTLCPSFHIELNLFNRKKGKLNTKFISTSATNGTKIQASLIEAPVLWAGRICIQYALLKAGLAGSPANPIFSSELENGGDDLGFSKWFEELQGKPEKEAADKRKLVSKWHPTTKGTLRRNYRIPSKSEGRRLLKAIASLLSDDDHFRDATSHKGCQIRRESAHGETVCCNNVRALFDELPTPHLTVEITPFPAGPLTDKDYDKAEKLEKVLRLWTRKEKEIAIVTHSGFLFHTLKVFGNDCHPLMRKEICKHFANCELRSMVIVDSSMSGSDSSTTNYPGKIPSGPDLPSDFVNEKVKKDELES